ncbi:MAG: carboxy-S-adenosyl-L-methionine synthase CmoA [Candidatus Omnitrophica bacterium]|nr:carboxy-S-adenosyl-L-methionine synthase CmoA [Candidatus Omnitrophota bacterium]
MKKDKLFVKKGNLLNFDFGKETAAVFDDMLDRSVPFYRELQRMIGEIAAEFAQDKTNVYDLGCSTGITLFTLHNSLPKNVNLVGVDYSQEMLKKCRERFAADHIKRNPRLICADLNKPISIKNASVVVLNLTLQFIRPIYRDRLIKCVYNGLIDKGCLILIEKVLGNNSMFNRTFIKLYYDMKKRQGYSDLEIARKREALENVLIPYRLDENRQLLRRNGFSHMDIFYKWYNFCGIAAIK